MMRILAWIVTFALLAFAGQTGFALWTEINAPPETVELAALPESDGGTAEPQPPAPPRSWPAVFGEPEPPKPPAAPPAPPAPEPQPPKPPKPPLESLGYELKGMVTMENVTWAMVNHATGEQLVRPGHMLREGIEVVRIDGEGVWVSRDGDAPELLGFSE
ncbi:hypothetical protein [Tropicibacter sp. S64]|uniref:hypothetical protein n=1 Tax=Tropicibacter sp. S64 TaxID=3415122 RepID=UPI003C7DC537